MQTDSEGEQFKSLPDSPRAKFIQTDDEGTQLKTQKRTHSGIPPATGESFRKWWYIWNMVLSPECQL